MEFITEAPAFGTVNLNVGSVLLLHYTLDALLWSCLVRE